MDTPELFTIVSPSQSSKIAGFDLDDTLIQTKSRCKFPLHEQDWEWKYPNVPDKIRQLQSQGYECLLFSNQFRLKEMTKRKIQTICAELQIGAYVAKQKNHFRKPEGGMWDIVIQTHPVNINVDSSFFCGDAAGREGDFANSDLLFAQTIGIPFYTPEEIFEMDTL